MDRFDFSPLFRSTIGFDRLARLVDSASRVDNTATTYPPYNIEKTGENTYRLTMAVAGFAQDELDITVQGEHADRDRQGQEEEENGRYLHRGIARRAFERRFSLADHIKVEGASLDNGLLHVDLVREVPEAMKPRTIAINGPSRPGRKWSSIRPRNLTLPSAVSTKAPPGFRGRFRSGDWLLGARCAKSFTRKILVADLIIG